MESDLSSDAGTQSTRPPIRQHCKAVVDVRVPIQNNVSKDGRRQNFVYLAMPDKQDGEPSWLQPRQGQPGSFFSIHSTNQQPISCVYDVSQKETKYCLCCTVTAASIQERWSPYKPGNRH